MFSDFEQMVAYLVIRYSVFFFLFLSCNYSHSGQKMIAHFFCIGSGEGKVSSHTPSNNTLNTGMYSGAPCMDATMVACVKIVYIAVSNMDLQLFYHSKCTGKCTHAIRTANKLTSACSHPETPDFRIAFFINNYYPSLKSSF